MRYTVTVEGRTFDVKMGRGGRVWVNHRPLHVDFRIVDNLSRYSLLVDHRSYEAYVERAEDAECCIVVAGHSYLVQVHQKRRATKADLAPIRPSTLGEVHAPLPGLLVEVPVVVGQRVRRGEVVAVLESMKMNLELQAPLGGIIQELHGDLGMEVSHGQVLAIVKPDE